MQRDMFDERERIYSPIFGHGVVLEDRGGDVLHVLFDEGDEAVIKRGCLISIPPN